MPNVHTPERQPTETQREYRARREASRLLARLMMHGPQQQPYQPRMRSNGQEELVPMGNFWLGQHTNPGRNTSRKALKAAGGHRQYKRDMKFVRRSLTSASARGLIQV